MNYLDLFHGIGGFALGAYWAGMKFEHHYCSDIEPWCQELYAKRFPDSIQLGDITKIDTSKLPAGDWIITGGFPCQDISIAGKGAGIHGERSGLWFEYWRIINDLRPRFAIMENVGMLVHRGLREVLGSLAEIGYDAEWQDIRASDVGAPHKRERIWIVAYRSDAGITRREWIAGNGAINGDRGNAGRGRRIGNAWRENVPNPSLQLPHGSGEARRGWGEFTDGGEISHSSIPRLEGEITTGEFRGRQPGLLAKCDWWSTEPAIRGMADGLPAELHGYEGRLASKSHQRVDRLRGLGNAIVPQIAELLFRQIFAKNS